MSSVLGWLLLVALGSVAQAPAPGQVQELFPPTPQPVWPPITQEKHEDKPAKQEKHEEDEHHEEHHEKERFWFRAEYLLWWIKDGGIPVLATTGNPTDALPGALGQRGTRPLFADADLDSLERHGARFLLGGWLDRGHCLGLEVGGLFLAARTRTFDRAENGGAGSPLLARPFFDVLSNRENVSLVAYPGLAQGRLHIDIDTNLHSFECNCLTQPVHEEIYHLDLLAGVRYLYLNEALNVVENVQVSPLALRLAGNTIRVEDHFDARNQFLGAQVGVKAWYQLYRLEFDFVGKLAVGMVHQKAGVRGSTDLTPPNQPTVSTGRGLLALDTNSGEYERSSFAIVPEAGVNLSYRWTPKLRTYVGYNIAYLSAAARPGNLIDRNINVSHVPTSGLAGAPTGPARPEFQFQETDFWAHGLNVGVELRY